MGDLAFAGALSGAGQAMGQGLLNLQQGIIQSGLIDQRQQLENQRMQLMLAHNEAMTDKRIAADRALQQEKLGGDIALQSMREQGETGRVGMREQAATGRAAMEQEGANQRVQTTVGGELARAGIHESGQDRRLERSESGATQRAGMHEEGETTRQEKGLAARKAEKDAENTLAGRKLDIEEQHNKDWKEVYAKIAEARARGTGTPADYKRYDMYKDFLIAQTQAIRDQLKDPLTPPEERDRLNGELHGMKTELQDLLQIERKAPAGPGIVSPFPLPGSATGSTGRLGEAQAAPPPSTLNPPQPTNVVREGRKQLAEAQAALNTAKAEHAAPALIQQLQQKVDELTARWGSP